MQLARKVCLGVCVRLLQVCFAEGKGRPTDTPASAIDAVNDNVASYGYGHRSGTKPLTTSYCSIITAKTASKQQQIKQNERDIKRNKSCRFFLKRKNYYYLL